MEKLSTKKTLCILDNQWATTRDVMLLGACGKNKALEIKREIKSELESKGYYLPYNLVPMEKVIDYFNININYLKKISGGNNA